MIILDVKTFSIFQVHLQLSSWRCVLTVRRAAQLPVCLWFLSARFSGSTFHKHCKGFSVIADDSSSRIRVCWRLLAGLVLLFCAYCFDFSMQLPNRFLITCVTSPWLRLSSGLCTQSGWCLHWSVTFLSASHWFSATHVEWFSKRQLAVPLFCLSLFHPFSHLPLFHPSISKLSSGYAPNFLTSSSYDPFVSLQLASPVHSGISCAFSLPLWLFFHRFQENNSYPAFYFTPGCHLDTLIFHCQSWCTWWILTRVSVSYMPLIYLITYFLFICFALPGPDYILSYMSTNQEQMNWN